MKYVVKIKDPDLFHALTRGVTEKRRERIYKEYTDYGEYFDIEIDTKTLRARLLKKG